MKKILGVAAVCLLAVVGCGGSSEAPTDEEREFLSDTATVLSLARAIGEFEDTDAERVNRLIDLCQKYPDFEEGGTSFPDLLEDAAYGVNEIAPVYAEQLLTAASEDCK